MTPNPFILLSAAMTIDGKIASKAGDPELSDEQDWKEVHKLRSEVDAIMVGKNTILKDNPKLHIKYHEHKGYYRIVVDSNLFTPINSNVITFQPDIYPTIFCCTENASEEKINRFESKGVRIIRSGTAAQVDIKNLLPQLHAMGIKSILLEGGGNLNWSFIRNNLVDEIRLAIAPWIIGGKDATSLVEGEGFEKMLEAPRYELIKAYNRENYVILRYKKRG
ncbi:MAG: 2,5-diamino-6-(ribosylamino)-4(3H)-pyrimidinone 5'-phosphate reductase [Promethearchaeota archaeon]